MSAAPPPSSYGFGLIVVTKTTGVRHVEFCKEIDYKHTHIFCMKHCLCINCHKQANGVKLESCILKLICSQRLHWWQL